MHVLSQSPLLNDEEAANFLSVTPRHIRRLWQQRQLGGVKVGRFVRFTEDDLAAYIARQRVEAIAQRPSDLAVRRVRAGKESINTTRSKGGISPRKATK